MIFFSLIIMSELVELLISILSDRQERSNIRLRSLESSALNELSILRAMMVPSELRIFTLMIRRRSPTASIRKDPISPPFNFRDMSNSPSILLHEFVYVLYKLCARYSRLLRFFTKHTPRLDFFVTVPFSVKT